MKRILVILMVFVSIASAQTRTTVSDLSWFTGFWKMENNGVIIEEYWHPVRDNAMEGRSTTTKDEKVIDSETMRIDQNAKGEIKYHAKPAKQKGASFTLVMIDSVTAVFENVKHDFPQRIIYRKISGDELQAEIEGTVKGKKRKTVFNFVKVIVEQI